MREAYAPRCRKAYVPYDRRSIGRHVSDGGPRSAVTPWPSAPERQLTGRDQSGSAVLRRSNHDFAARLAKGGE